MTDTELIYRAIKNRHYGIMPGIDEWKRYCENDAELTRNLYITVGRGCGKTRMLNEIINKRIEELKMKKINWNVNRIEVDETFRGTKINVDIRGYAGEMLECTDLGRLRDHIERCLNFDMDVSSMYPTIPKLRVAITHHPDRIIPEIKDVIFNGPATIVLWKDGTKTVVKAQEGEFIDYEKGMAMAIAKRILGNKGSYYNVFDKYLPKEEAEEE